MMSGRKLRRMAHSVGLYSAGPPATSTPRGVPDPSRALFSPVSAPRNMAPDTAEQGDALPPLRPSLRLLYFPVVERRQGVRNRPQFATGGAMWAFHSLGSVGGIG